MTEIKLPPLPHLPLNDPAAAYKAVHDHGKQCAIAAIEADRKHFAELFMDLSRYANGMYEQDHDPQMEGVSDGYWYAAEFLIGKRDAINELEADRQARGEPVAWLVTGPYEKTAFSDKTMAEKFCIGLNKGYGEVAYKVTPLYTAPLPQQQAGEPVRPRHVELALEENIWRNALIGLCDTDRIDTPEQAIKNVKARMRRMGFPQPPQIPEGYKIVPIEPTEEMIEAANQGDRLYTDRCFGKDMPTVMQGPYDHYKAMLEAAPDTSRDSDGNHPIGRNPDAL